MNPATVAELISDQEQHDTAVELLPVERGALFRSVARVDLLCVQIEASDGADRAALSNQARRFFLCFSVQGADEVLMAAYECDPTGRVQAWNARFEMWGRNPVFAIEKLRFAIINEVIQAWTL